MVAWWPLDEQPGSAVVGDMADGDNPGIPHDANMVQTTISAMPGPPPAGPVPVTAPPLSLPSGMVGSALYFYGPYIEVADHPDLHFGTGSFSIDAWIYYVPLSPVPPGSGPVIAPIVDKFDPVSNTGYAFFLYVDTTGTHLRFRTWDGTSSSVAGFPAPTVVPQTWHHLTVTVDRPGTGVSIYINGVAAVTQAQVVTGSVDNTTALWIGKSRLHAMLNAGFREIAVDELEIFNRALNPQEVQAIHAAGSAGKCKSDLGDAPDSTNHANAPMLAYAATPANFPTVYDPNLTGNAPLGPVHLAANGLAWLGTDVSVEGEADTGWDQDLTGNNIQPPIIADRDQFDDGVGIVLLPDCAMTNLSFSATNALPGTTQVYVNVWFDWTRDGDWDDLPKCAVAPNVDALAPEWTVQNHAVTLTPGFNSGLVTPSFRSINPPPGRQVWARIMLTDVPINAANHGGPFTNPADLGKGGSGPVGGYPYGETEDYSWRVESGTTEVCVTKFEDQNGNGVQDSGEPGLSGWQIDVTDIGGNVVATHTTTPSGTICFGVPAPATYTISEVLQSGWAQTAPQPVPPGTHTVTLSPGQLVNLSFGNRRACVPPPPGIRHWWPFEETSGPTAQDIVGGRTGNTQPGAIGGPGPLSVAGKIGNAFQLNGTSTYVEVPDGPGTLSFGNPTDSFSIDAWVKVNPQDKSGVRPVVDKRLQQGNSLFGYTLFLFNGQLSFQLADNLAGGLICAGGPPFTSSCTNYVSTVDVADGLWHHVAVTIQRTGTPEVRLYVDGSLAFTGVARAGNANNNASLRIGTGYPIVISQPYFRGVIDELELFNRALTQQEIQAIHGADSAGKCKGRRWMLHLPLVLKQ